MNALRRIAGLAALCLAPAVAMSADAPKASVTVYGTLNVNAQVVDATGTSPKTNDVKSRVGVSVDSSNIGVRALLKLDDMIGGVAQCETSANVDGIGGAGLCNRNSRVGLTGAWGTLFYGNWDTPYKLAAYGTKADDPFGNTDVYDAAGLLTSPGFNTTTGGFSTASNTSVTRFTIRGQNAIVYHSPVFMGLSAKLHYTSNEFKNATGTQNPELYSGVVNFETKDVLPIPCSVLAVVEQHKDGFGLVGINGTTRQLGATVANTAGNATTSLHTTDTGLRFGAGCQVDTAAGATTLNGTFEILTYKQDGAPTGALSKYERSAWQIGLKHRYGNHEIRARYSMADKGKATVVGGTGNADQYGASNLALGYAYYIVPDALQVYVYYTQITNEDRAQYTFGTGGPAAVSGATPAGADPKAFGLGTRFAF